MTARKKESPLASQVLDQHLGSVSAVATLRGDGEELKDTRDTGMEAEYKKERAGSCRKAEN